MIELFMCDQCGGSPSLLSNAISYSNASRLGYDTKPQEQHIKCYKIPRRSKSVPKKKIQKSTRAMFDQSKGVSVFTVNIT
jgi:hypothetical protein